MLRPLFTIFALFALFSTAGAVDLAPGGKAPDFTLVGVCRYPFANTELEAFCDDVEQELKRKLADVGDAPNLDFRLAPVTVMRQHLKKRQMEDSGVTGISVWAESHCAIHTWDEDNYFSFDAFSCTDFNPADAIRLLLNTFDIEMMNCVNVMRFQRGMPRTTHFQVNDRWEVTLNGTKLGELDSYDFR